MTLVNEELINLLNGNYYTIQTDDDTSGICLLYTSTLSHLRAESELLSDRVV